MNINLKIASERNGNRFELEINDIGNDEYYELQNWGIKTIKEAMNELSPANEKPVETTTTTTTTYAPGTNPKGAMASQKQINFLHALGYAGDCSNLSVTEANNIIAELKSKNK